MRHQENENLPQSLEFNCNNHLGVLCVSWTCTQVQHELSPSENLINMHKQVKSPLLGLTHSYWQILEGIGTGNTRNAKFNIMKKFIQKLSKKHYILNLNKQKCKLLQAVMYLEYDKKY